MVFRKWWHRGPANCRRTCHAHLKTGVPRDRVPETLFLLQPSVTHFLDELERPDWRSQHLDSLWAPHFRTQIDHDSNIASSAVPATDYNFSPTKLYKRRVRSGLDTNTIQERQQFLPIQHFLFRFVQCVVNCEAEKKGHERVRLFAPRIRKAGNKWT